MLIKYSIIIINIRSLKSYLLELLFFEQYDILNEITAILEEGK